jgi:uncharacterized protein (DUF2126 family)
MRVRIRHETHYVYHAPAELGPHIIRLRPAAHTRARVLTYNLDVGQECDLRWQYDPWSNRIARIVFTEGSKVDELRVIVDAAFDIRPVNPFDFYVDERAGTFPFAYPEGLSEELAPFLGRTPFSGRLAAFIGADEPKGYVVDYLVAVNRRVASDVRYLIRNEPGIQTSEETLERGSGSCRDSALLLCDVLRARGFATRFVSGYLVQLADEGILPDEAKGVSDDVVDLHAWAEVYLPGAGWIGLDGTSGLLVGETHIPLACAITPQLAAPISGSVSQPTRDFRFSMSVERIGHEPRPQRPYEDGVWEGIVSAGDAVDGILAGHGIQLTSGGEPTWTSRLHPLEPEWNTEALGKTKWEQALRLADELSRRMGHGTLAMHRFGKHYPGESLPRWAMQLIWREDGVPVWQDRERLRFAPRPEAGVRNATDVARTLGARIADGLGVEPNLVPAYEDPWPVLTDEQNLPPGVDPLDADLDDPDERLRLAKVLGQGLGRPVGYALPVQCWNARWVTGEWKFRRGHLFLIPGDSPIGLRLPLNRLPGRAVEFPPADRTVIIEPIGFDPRDRLNAAMGNASRRLGLEEEFGKDAILQTALCVEVRDGLVHVFVPPLPTAEAFLELIATVERSAELLNLDVRIEGYPPPADPRLQSCLITPDPGVIEVNMPVTSSFREYNETMALVNDAANHAGLATAKYQLDGREVGSGGGNHLTLGGPSTAESPFLGRPDLLGSLLRYLQHHPSLSYLFTGLFVGPTSQAPRIDEARHDSLIELEMALRQIPDPGVHVSPWEVDRLLRNILVDVSGNTHRTEVCIDKLYAPEGPSGRIGIVELRAFEMPPNERMAAVEMLLMRALIARFALEPYDRPFIRWGTALHDRFMLPHFLEQDIGDVVRDLGRLGIPAADAWFRPFVDYRFPVYGTLQIDDMEIEVRNALEPWPTLGEQPSGPVVARYVDSSLERLQVRARGLIPDRHKIAVNGIELPMHPVGTVTDAVAGVRYRAWQPPFCMQPNIPPHHPLRFDIVDTWARRSLGSCTYHVWHPDGRAFEDPPLTAFEAAARRAQRFTAEGHAPWPVRIRPTTPHPDHPLTLDLRWASICPAPQD